MEKNWKIYMCVLKSLHCTPETNPILQINYISIKKKFLQIANAHQKEKKDPALLRNAQ